MSDPAKRWRAERPHSIRAGNGVTDLLHRHTHARTTQLRLPNKAIPTSQYISLLTHIKQFQLITTQHTRQHNIQLRVREIDTDTVAGAAAEGHVELIYALEVGVAFEPALGAEGVGVGEDGGGVENVPEGHGDGVAGGDEVGVVGEGLEGGDEGEAGGEEGA